MGEDQHRVTELRDGVDVVAHQNDGLAAGLELLDLVEALELKARIPDGQGFVDEQDVGVHVDGGREGQSDLHSR